MKKEPIEFYFARTGSAGVRNASAAVDRRRQSRKRGEHALRCTVGEKRMAAFKVGLGAVEPGLVAIVLRNGAGIDHRLDPAARHQLLATG